MTVARRLKLVAAIGAALLTATGLTACQSHVGAAAYVGSTRISESSVGQLVTRDATTSVDQTSGATDSPKSEALTSLILTDLVNRVLQARKIQPTAAQLDTARTAALQQIGIPSLTALEAAATPAGFSKSYASVYLDELARISILESALKDTDGSQVAKAISALHIKVSVSPRYGDWDLSALSVSSGPSVPSFLTVSSTAAAATDATAPDDGTGG